MENFRVMQPSVLLRPYIKQYWFLKIENTTHLRQRLIPRGCLGLTFNRGGGIYSSSENSFLPSTYLFGQAKQYSDLSFCESLDQIFVVFQPIGAKAIFNYSIRELNGQAIPIRDLKDPLLADLEKRLMDTPCDEVCVKLIEDFLLKHITCHDTHNLKRLTAVITSINEGESDLYNLAQTACLSYKQFKRIFVTYTGLNPKEFLQIARFSKTLHTLQTKPSSGLDEIADECDYYDKSHLIKEMRAFSGYTPSELLQNFDPYSEYMSLFQSFFINTK